MPKQIFKYLRYVDEHAGQTFWLRNKRLFSDSPWCPYCRTPTKTVFSNQERDEPYEGDPLQSWREHDVQVRACEECGWWDMFDNDTSGDCDEAPWYTDTYRRAILQEYTLADAQVPIDALSAELLRHREEIHQIHDKAMERLVAAVMHVSYPGAEVELCGRTGDGGVDLFVIRGDKTIIIQVKRRVNPEKPEPVSSVRELLGVSVDKGVRNLIFVSTAPHFTGSRVGARAFAERVVRNRKVDQFDLISRDQFIGMLDLSGFA